MIEIIHLPSQSERLAKFRCRANTDGTMNCSTKIENNKGKKAYDRNRMKRENREMFNTDWE